MTYINQLRPVLFLFYSVETFINIVLMHYYLSALVFIQETTLFITKYTWYYSYLVFIYFFTVLTLLASVNVCTKNKPSILEEVIRPLVAFIAYTILTFLALFDATENFPFMFVNTANNDVLQPEKPLQPYFKFLRAQATASLSCSVVYLLHCFIALDVLLSNEDSDSEEERLSEDSDIVLEVEAEYTPVRLFVLGSHMQRWLESFQWFRDYINEGVQEI
ncbi:uncharacterized protein [Drosophila kikkawai]|uniref:DUF7775 domain-containing protein n=1 Tax=Drosophila kikkawai TaxID=30033 RepID=A0A6P4J5J4_DROKI|nr:uncharacterized protein LOC108084830 [Drosophila kikkawai]